MAVVCGDCRMDNRDGARFCKGCGRRLASASAGEVWPETERMPLAIPVAPPGIFDPAPAAGPAAARSRPPAVARNPARTAPAAPLPAAAAFEPSRSRAVPAASEPAASRVSWRMLGVLAIAVIVGGGWYLLATGTSDQPPIVAAPVAAMPAAPADTPPPIPAAPAFEARLAAPPPAAIEPAAPAPPLRPARAVASRPRAAIESKPRKPASAPVGVPAAVAAAVPLPMPAEAPPLAAPPDPQAACADLSFFSRARCMAAQCAKAEFRASPQCEPVRRQQQIDEEKRNPTLAD